MALLVDRVVKAFEAWTPKKELQAKTVERRRHLCYWKMPSKVKAADTKHVSEAYRLHVISEWVLGTIHGLITAFGLRADGKIGMGFVAIEDYAMGHRQQRGHLSLAELAGTVKAGLWNMGIPYRTYDPMSVKLAMTGDGSAEKSKMIRAAEQRFKIDLQPFVQPTSVGDPDKIDKAPGPAGDIADAIALANLLDYEVRVKEGLVDLKDLKSGTRAVLLRTTAANPVALVSRAFIHKGRYQGDEPTWPEKI